jgi:hypothetical protein
MPIIHVRLQKDMFVGRIHLPKCSDKSNQFEKPHRNSDWLKATTKELAWLLGIKIGGFKVGAS